MKNKFKPGDICVEHITDDGILDVYFKVEVISIHKDGRINVMFSSPTGVTWLVNPDHLCSIQRELEFCEVLR